MKKHISTLVCVAIMFIMLFGVQLLERSCSVQRSWWCKGQICHLHHMRSRCSRVLTSIDFHNWHKWQLEYYVTCFYYTINITDLITVKESNHQNKVHAVKARYTVGIYVLSVEVNDGVSLVKFSGGSFRCWTVVVVSCFKTGQVPTAHAQLSDHYKI